MRCPFCDYEETQVRDSRATDEGKGVRRRRECSNCNARFTTFERARLKELFVIKRSGVKKKLDHQKIVQSIQAAIRKRSISAEQVEKIADKVVHEVESGIKGEIPSRKIGEIVMQELGKIDQVAYIRFASVYKDFSSVNDFLKFIGKLK
jgi:transcriptional repressor NrdR